MCVINHSTKAYLTGLTKFFKRFVIKNLRYKFLLGDI